MSLAGLGRASRLISNGLSYTLCFYTGSKMKRFAAHISNEKGSRDVEGTTLVGSLYPHIGTVTPAVTTTVRKDLIQAFKLYRRERWERRNWKFGATSLTPSHRETTNH